MYESKRFTIVSSNPKLERYYLFMDGLYIEGFDTAEECAMQAELELAFEE